MQISFDDRVALAKLIGYCQGLTKGECLGPMIAPKLRELTDDAAKIVLNPQREQEPA